MPVTAPPSVTALPTPPSTASPSTFDTRADAFLGALPNFQTETNSVAANVFSNATDAATSATTAATQASSASASATSALASATLAATSGGAAVWVSGTTYGLNVAVRSPANQRIYIRIVAGAGTTDPSSDPTNWAVLGIEAPYKAETGASFTMVTGVRHGMKNAAASTGILPASPAQGDCAYVKVMNGRADNVLDPGANTIEGFSGTMPLDNPYGSYSLQFLDSSWRLI